MWSGNIVWGSTPAAKVRRCTSCETCKDEITPKHLAAIQRARDGATYRSRCPEWRPR